MMKRGLCVILCGLCLCGALWGCAGPAAEALPAVTSQVTVGDGQYADDLDGLCAFLEASGAVVRGETEAAFTEMSYKEIGAIGGYRYRFTCGGGTVQAEFYEFDLENLDAKGQECLDSVRETGRFTVLGNEVQGTLHPSGKYLMIYNDSGSGEENEAQRKWVEDRFLSFQTA